MPQHKTAYPLLIDLAEVEFQISLSQEKIAILIELGELETVTVDGEVLVTWDSLTNLARRMRARKIWTMRAIRPRTAEQNGKKVAEE